MEFDNVIGLIGEFGRTQLRTVIFGGLATMSTALQMMVTVFMQQIPLHRCVLEGLDNDTFNIQGAWHQDLINQTIPVDADGEYEGCLRLDNSSLVPCSDWVFDTSIFPKTFPTEFGLLCDSSKLVNMVNVVYLAGVTAGAIVGGLAADYVGRKPVTFIAVLIHGVSGVGAAFSPNYGSFVAFRFFVGSCHGVLNNSVVVISMEFVSPRRRMISVLSLAISWAIGMILTTAFAYLIRDWRYLQLAVALPPFLYLGFWWFVPESPRWLLSRGRYSEAERIVRWAAEVNGGSLPECEKLFDETSLKVTPTINPLKILEAPRLVARTVVVILGWITVGTAWYGLTLNQGSLDGDLFINSVVLSFIDLICYISLVVINKIGRKPMYCVCMVMSTLAMFSTLPVHYLANKESPSTSVVFTTLYTIGKLGVSGCFSLLFLWNPEFYPTPLRNFGLGLGCTFGRIGAMVSPIIMGELGEHPVLGNTAPLILFGCMTLASALSGLYLPETNHKHLPETLEDAQNFGVKRKEEDVDKKAFEDHSTTIGQRLAFGQRNSTSL